MNTFALFLGWAMIAFGAGWGVAEIVYRTAVRFYLRTGQWSDLVEAMYIVRHRKADK